MGSHLDRFHWVWARLCGPLLLGEAILASAVLVSLRFERTSAAEALLVIIIGLTLLALLERRMGREASSVSRSGRGRPRRSGRGRLSLRLGRAQLPALRRTPPFLRDPMEPWPRRGGCTSDVRPPTHSRHMGGKLCVTTTVSAAAQRKLALLCRRRECPAPQAQLQARLGKLVRHVGETEVTLSRIRYQVAHRRQ
jgi:hypothetical protein